MNWIDIVKVFHAIWVPLFVAIVIWKSTMQEFREFIDALHSPGTSILIGFLLVGWGFIMMKVMLYEDGKYIVGAGVGLLIKSLNGTTPASSQIQATEFTRTTTDVTPIEKPKETINVSAVSPQEDRPAGEQV